MIFFINFGQLLLSVLNISHSLEIKQITKNILFINQIATNYRYNCIPSTSHHPRLRSTSVFAEISGAESGKISGQGRKNVPGADSGAGSGAASQAQPPKGQSLLKQEENGLICFTSFCFLRKSTRVRLRYRRIVKSYQHPITSSNENQHKIHR